MIKSVKGLLSPLLVAFEDLVRFVKSNVEKSHQMVSQNVPTIILCLHLWVDVSFGYTILRQAAASSRPQGITSKVAESADLIKAEVKVGDFLESLPTPSLLLEISLLERFLTDNNHDAALCSVDELLADPARHADYFNKSFHNCRALYVHTRVTSTAQRDIIVSREGCGKSLFVCLVDTPVELVSPGGAYLGLGLANHHVGGYYWARSMGIGASLPAHGIHFGAPSAADADHKQSQYGELCWKKRGPGDPAETTEESSNSNDGKRSEWADFLKVGDTVQLVPHDPWGILFQNDIASSNPQFETLFGIRRTGRPLGADPIVERIWVRTEDKNKNGINGWAVQQPN